jgi:lysophospholipase L1-like esterase
VALLWVSPSLLYLYPALASLLVKSRTPMLLGRYSTGLAVFAGWNLFLCLIALWAWKTQRRSVQGALALAILLSTFVVPMNSELRRLPAIGWVLPLTRLLAAGVLLAAAFARFRQGRRRGVGALVSVGMLFVVISLVDFALLSWVALASLSQEKAVPEAGFRFNYDLSAITPHDAILVGDSFVWGAAVAPEEAFGQRWQSLNEDKNVHVYSLGIPGSDVLGYIDILKRVPPSVKVRRVVMAFYMNDMPPVADAGHYVEGLVNSVGVGCPTLRLVGEQLSKQLTPDVEEYHRSLVRCFDKQEPTFARRRQILESQLREFRDLAAERSSARPTLLLLPLMVDFRDYPLTEAHQDLTQMAQTLGYDVIDLLPTFAAQLGDGSQFRARPNDNHFNAAVHAVVARVLHEKCDACPE